MLLLGSTKHVMMVPECLYRAPEPLAIGTSRVATIGCSGPCSGGTSAFIKAFKAFTAFTSSKDRLSSGGTGVGVGGGTRRGIAAGRVAAEHDEVAPRLAFVHRPPHDDIDPTVVAVAGTQPRRR